MQHVSNGCLRRHIQSHSQWHHPFFSVINELTNAPLLFFPPITDCKLHQFHKHLLLDTLSTVPTCATKQRIVQHTRKTKRCHYSQLPIACAHFIMSSNELCRISLTLCLLTCHLSVCLPRPSRGSQCSSPVCQQQHQSKGGLSGTSLCQLCCGYQVQRSAKVPIMLFLLDPTA